MTARTQSHLATAEHVPLGHVAEIFVGDYASPRKQGRTGGLWLSVSDLGDDGTLRMPKVPSTLLTHQENGISVPIGCAVRPGDILLPSRSTSLKYTIVPAAFDGHVINASLIAIRCGERLLPRVLLAYLEHPEGRLAIVTASQSGTHQICVTVKALSGLLVPVPPMAQQRRLAELLDVSDVAHRHAVEAASMRRKIVQNLAFETINRSGIPA